MLPTGRVARSVKKLDLQMPDLKVSDFVVVKVVVNTSSCCLQEVTPWEVKGNEEGKIDYAKLVREVSLPCSSRSFFDHVLKFPEYLFGCALLQFGCSYLDQALLDR